MSTPPSIEKQQVKTAKLTYKISNILSPYDDGLMWVVHRHVETDFAELIFRLSHNLSNYILHVVTLPATSSGEIERIKDSYQLSSRLPLFTTCIASPISMSSVTSEGQVTLEMLYDFGGDDLASKSGTYTAKELAELARDMLVPLSLTETAGYEPSRPSNLGIHSFSFKRGTLKVACLGPRRKSDVYNWGMVMLQLVTGKIPTESDPKDWSKATARTYLKDDPEGSVGGWLVPILVEALDSCPGNRSTFSELKLTIDRNIRYDHEDELFGRMRTQKNATVESAKHKAELKKCKRECAEAHSVISKYDYEFSKFSSALLRLHQKTVTAHNDLGQKLRESADTIDEGRIDELFVILEATNGKGTWKKVREAYNGLTTSSAKEIELHDNSIGGIGIDIIAHGLKQSNKVEKLNLGDSKIRTYGMMALGEALNQHPSLTTLDLGVQSSYFSSFLPIIMSVAWYCIMYLICGKPKLAFSIVYFGIVVAATVFIYVSLDIDRNDVSNEGAKALANGIKGCKCLTTVRLDYCVRAEEDQARILQAINQNGSIKQVSVYGFSNKLVVKNLKRTDIIVNFQLSGTRS